MMNASIVHEDIGAAKITRDISHHAFNCAGIGQLRAGKASFDILGLRDFLFDRVCFIVACKTA